MTSRTRSITATRGTTLRAALASAAALVLVAVLPPAPPSSASPPRRTGEAHSGVAYLYSQTADRSYKRLDRQFTVPDHGGSLTFWVAYDTEVDYDFLLVEAQTPGSADWTTLPDANGHTTTSPGSSCSDGWVELHPQLAHYQTWDGAGGCTGDGTTGTWNAASGASQGWEKWSVDLDAYAGGPVFVSISYVSDWASQGAGVFVDDVTLPDGTSTSFENGTGGWSVDAPPAGSPRNHNSYVLTSNSRCEPQAYMLPGLSGAVATATAVSDSGWVVGGSDGHAIAWHDPSYPIDTGVGGSEMPNGSTVTGIAEDVNESGVVVLDRTTLSKRGAVVASDVLLWTETDGLSELPATATRPFARAEAINDHGVVAGTLDGRRIRSVPVVWRQGDVVRLTSPPNKNAVVLDISNRGLVVGAVAFRYDLRPWFWHIDGRNGPLETRHNGMATTVDDAGRILGQLYTGEYEEATALWRTTSSAPEMLFDPLVPYDIHDSGFIAISDDGFRGYGGLAYIGRLTGTHATSARLPGPYLTSGWAYTRAEGLARGTSAFAPQGGVTVVGIGDTDDYGLRAVVWTCAQTRLQ